MEHYGIRDKELLLFKSYFTDRQQFVEIDTFKSDMLKSPDIYNKKITNKQCKKYDNVRHLTVNFVDDSSNIIGFYDIKQIQQYLTDFYTLLHCYYNINKL